MGKLSSLKNFFFEFLKSKIFRLIISLPITYIFVYYYFSEIENYNVYKLLLNVDINIIFFTFIFATLASILRAIRLKKIALLSGSKSISFFSMFHANNLSLAINIIAPMRLGDAIGVIIIQKVIRIKNSLLIILVDRIFDLFFALMIFLFCSFVIGYELFVSFKSFALFFLSFFLLIFAFLIIFRKNILNYLKRTLSAGLLDWFLNFLYTLIKMFSSIKSIQIIILSLLIWFAFSLQIWVGTNFFLPQLNSLQILLIVSSVSLGQIIHLTPSNLGIFHSIFISLCILFNIKFEDALAPAIFTHLGMVTTSLLYGLIASLYKYKSN